MTVTTAIMINATCRYRRSRSGTPRRSVQPRLTTEGAITISWMIKSACRPGADHLEHPARGRQPGEEEYADHDPQHTRAIRAIAAVDRGRTYSAWALWDAARKSSPRWTHTRASQPGNMFSRERQTAAGSRLSRTGSSLQIFSAAEPPEPDCQVCTARATTSTMAFAATEAPSCCRISAPQSCSSQPTTIISKNLFDGLSDS